MPKTLSQSDRITALEDALFYSLEANIETLMLIKTGVYDHNADVTAWVSKYRRHFLGWQRTLGADAVKRLLGARKRALDDLKGGKDG